MILLRGGEYLSPKGRFEKADILIKGRNIHFIGTNAPSEFDGEVLNMEGYRLIPGLVDIHCHGALGYDLMGAAPDEIHKISEYLAFQGTTSFFPTTITSSRDELEAALKNIQKAAFKKGGASIEGVHIEGPYINPIHKGCHNPVFMRAPQISEYKTWTKLAAPLKIHITLAPELNGSKEFIQCAAAEGNTVGIGHSDACFEQVRQALEAGAGTFTHLFNGMRGLHHREPGVAGAALTSGAYVELICDGIHVHPEVIRLILRAKGKDRILLVTDAMQATGLGDGVYDFGGYPVYVSEGIARKEDGTLASSTLTLFRGLRNMMRFTGISLEEAVPMASTYPSKAVGIDHRVGSLEPGKRADIVVLDEQMEIAQVICGGSVTRRGAK